VLSSVVIDLLIILIASFPFVVIAARCLEEEFDVMIEGELSVILEYNELFA